MPPETGTALLIIVAFVLPGFVTVLIKERTHETARDATELDRLLRTAYYSVWSYVLLALVALLFDINQGDVECLWDERRSEPARLALVAAGAIVVPSAILATTSRLWDGSEWQAWVHEKLRINDRHKIPTAWDHFFALRTPALVRATMKDGRVVGGFYGKKSFAAYARDGRDLYLEEQWVMDNDSWFKAPAEAAEGIWLPTEEIASIEFYTGEDGG